MSRFNELFEIIFPVVEAINARKGAAFLVGGAVRDMQMGGDPHDFDIEVFGIGMADLIKLLFEFGTVKATGVRFQVIKLSRGGAEFDFSLPRRDLGAGRNGFDTEADPFMDTREAAARRDFTINAMMLNLASGEIIDHFGGLDDIKARILRPVSDAFADDPLRIERLVQFAARFNFSPATDPVSIARFRACFTGEAGERLGALLGTDPMRAEAMKWFNAPFPGSGLRAMRDVGFTQFFPELATMENTPQDSRWHPEGDALTHTAFVMDVAADLCTLEFADGREIDRCKIVAAALCHDLGKPETTVIHDDGTITSAGHAAAGVPHTVSLLNKLGFVGQTQFVGDVASLVREHMITSGIADDTNMPRFVRRLSTRVNIAELRVLVTADCSGRPASAAEIGKLVFDDKMEQIASVAAAMDVAVAPPKPIVMGRDLVALGMKHGVKGVDFTAILRRCFDAQIDGVFSDKDGGIAFVESITNNNV